MSAPVIDLTESASCGLIVEWPTGVEYLTQTAGVACYHQRLEGYFLPLASDELGFEGKLIELFGELDYWKGIDVELADAVDRFLSTFFLTTDLRVDRSRLTECQEAWVWVTGTCPVLSDFGGIRGMLTWMNSD